MTREYDVESGYYFEDDMPSEKQLENWNEANEYTHEGDDDDDETRSHGPYADYTDLDWANEAENDRLQVHLEEQRRELGPFPEDKQLECGNCHGTGYFEYGPLNINCDACGGTGLVDPNDQ